MAGDLCDQELFPILINRMKKIGILLMWLMILTSTFVQVFINNSKQLGSFEALTNASVIKGVSGDFSLDFQKPNIIREHHSTVAANDVALERISISEETVAASLDGLTPENIDMVRKRNESGVTVRRLNTELAAVPEQLSSQETLNSELCNAQGACFRQKLSRRQFFCTLKPLSTIRCRSLNKLLYLR